jgi:DNA-binding MarR family transcriptional regulator
MAHKTATAAPSKRPGRVTRSSSELVRASRKARTKGTVASAELRVLQHLRELYRVSQQHFQRIEVRCGLSGAQLWALSELKARPASSISELASALSVHLSTASNLLDRLEDRKLISRHRGPPDQRIVRVSVTARGEAMLRLAPKPVEGIIQDALHRMRQDVLVRLDRDLEDLLRHAKARNPAAALKHLAEP